MLPTYQSLPVLNWWPDWSDPSRGIQYPMRANRVDGIAGAVVWDAPHVTRPRTARRLRFLFSTRAEALEGRRWIREVFKGRLKTAWVPLWVDAFKLAADVDDAATTMTITRSGYTDYQGGAGNGREHIAAWVQTGSGPELFYRQITGSTVDAEAGTETLTLDSAIGYDLTTRDPLSFLLLCRADSDALVLDWQSVGLAVLELPLIDIPRETPS